MDTNGDETLKNHIKSWVWPCLQTITVTCQYSYVLSQKIVKFQTRRQTVELQISVDEVFIS